MKLERLLLLLLAVFFMAGPSPVLADAPRFSLTKATPVGSWAEREERRVDHKDRETVSIIRQTMLDKVDVGGEPYFWVETETQTYKVNKKGDRKQQGDSAIMKVLIAKSALDGDPANLMKNLTGVGKDIIFQTGNAQPMRIREGGMMGGMMMQALGVQVDYQFKSMGNEKVTTPAGEFKAEKFAGTGSVESRILMQKISVRSESEFWMTPDIPFGFARMVSTDTVNGNPQSSESQVTSFGMAGGVSKISGEPRDILGGF